MIDRGETSGRGKPVPPSVQPVAAAIGVVIRGDEVLLVRRANRPDVGKWGFPGGRIEPGEAAPAAAVREVAEETGIIARPLQVLTAVDAFDRDEHGQLRAHYILVAVLCEWLSGNPQAADDALEAAWFDVASLRSSEIATSIDVERVASMALQAQAERS